MVRQPGPKTRILQKQLVDTFEQERFNLRKWISNEESIIRDLPPVYREANDMLEFFDRDLRTETLGFVWHHSEDCLRFPTSRKTTLKKGF